MLDIPGDTFGPHDQVGAGLARLAREPIEDDRDEHDDRSPNEASREKLGERDVRRDDDEGDQVLTADRGELEERDVRVLRLADRPERNGEEAGMSAQPIERDRDGRKQRNGELVIRELRPRGAEDRGEEREPQREKQKI